MEKLFDPGFYAQEIAAAQLWLVENALALSVATLVQAVVVGLAFLAARTAAPPTAGSSHRSRAWPGRCSPWSCRSCGCSSCG